MKLDKKIVCHLLLVILCMGLTGCGSISRVEPLSSGYEVVSYTRHSFSEPEATQITLQYRKPSGGRIVVWPSVETGPIIKGNVAIIIGLMGNHQTRVFAVEAPSLPLDITDEVLALGAKERGKILSQIPKSATIATLKETSGINFGVAFVDWTDRDVKLTWNQLSDIMHEVKEKGVVRKDRVWGTSYIEKEFKPEVQK